MPRICVAIQAETNEQIIKSVLKTDEADLIEIRLDYRKENLNLPAIRKSTDKLLIATNRRKDQGGNAVEPEQERLGLLMDAVDAGFDYVDIASTTESLAETVQALKEKGAKVIVSYHDFEHPLNAKQLEEKHRELAETGCDIIKIIGWTTNYDDNLSYLEYNKSHPGNVSFGMGEKGTPSRILAPLSGAAYTYASLETGRELASGQIPLKLLWGIYRSLL